MTKPPDFGNDLAELHDHVTAELGDVLQVLQQQRAAKGVMQTPQSVPSSAEVALSDGEIANEPQQPAAPARVARRRRLTSRRRDAPTGQRPEPLENVTTRLRRSTNELLTEAALRQRLKKRSPATRQDIIETALADWFHQHGYRFCPAEEV